MTAGVASAHEQRPTVIGVLADTVTEQMWGITTSQVTLAGILGARAAPTVYRLDLAERADTVARASRIYPAGALRCE